MRIFRVIYHLKSAVASAWQSDTIFGHLCWALRYLEGEDALNGLLDAYRNGTPPLIVSDGFPGDLLPNPILPPSTDVAGKSVNEQMRNFEIARESRKAQWLSLDGFNAVIRGEMPIAGRQPTPRTRVTLKNQISRLTGTTGGGGYLFEFEETYWRDGKADLAREIPVSIYLKVKDGFETRAEQLFGFLAAQGYGKRKSVGYGEIASMEFGEFRGFEPPGNPNGFVTLSHFVPAHGDPHDGYWRVLVKYGKLGEEFAVGNNPFKRPLVMLTPGSVFRCEGSPREYYGRWVKDICAKPGVGQYAFAFPVPMRLPQ
ncbi:MAG: hypothetical protein QUS33_07595 [Dehalococcoidia bacterium]|nr:hypothetical protein [Dehalococcoidia bacterium]